MCQTVASRDHSWHKYTRKWTATKKLLFDGSTVKPEKSARFKRKKIKQRGAVVAYVEFMDERQQKMETC